MIRLLSKNQLLAVNFWRWVSHFWQDKLLIANFWQLRQSWFVLADMNFSCIHWCLLLLFILFICTLSSSFLTFRLVYHFVKLTSYRLDCASPYICLITFQNIYCTCFIWAPLLILNMFFLSPVNRCLFNWWALFSFHVTKLMFWSDLAYLCSRFRWRYERCALSKENILKFISVGHWMRMKVVGYCLLFIFDLL